ncbi:SPOR domain-containing protein [Clostridium uliginosum]|uniref:Sporulation related domain-containing protein n=1 Tax=Clostridium uliginosum TaxID=119641 RepID=A0A1I1I654_9CLOT|nr:SPOR domain-containing protein [Clostridium uliginosum]SFC31505.1 hypothetical protein SAMN05421842_102134 [Clostridium uliginosum]
MRYTRYEYKKHGKIKFLCTIAIIAGLSIIIGLCFSKSVFKGKSNSNNLNQSVSVTNNEDFIALQYGYYAKKENAEAIIKNIPSKYNTYIVEEEGKYRVIIGLYLQQDGLNELEKLTSQGINLVKVNFRIPNNNLENKKIAEIIEGFLKISNKLEESEVKSIKTYEYKAWCLEIINSENSDDFKELKLIGEYVNNLPEKIDKTNVDINLKYFYEIIKKYKV